MQFHWGDVDGVGCRTLSSVFSLGPSQENDELAVKYNRECFISICQLPGKTWPAGCGTEWNIIPEKKNKTKHKITALYEQESFLCLPVML